ncbi:MAG: hypothetical protein ABW250_01675, partial [Pyrinomonadaceae bacterium]
LVNTTAGSLPGLLCGNRLSIKLSTPSNGVELLLTRANSETAPTVEAYNSESRRVASAQMQNPFNQPETIRLKGEDITRVEIKQPVANSAYLHRLCADGLGDETLQARVKVTAYSGTTPVRSIFAVGHPGKVVSAIVEADAMTSVEVGTGPAALVELCYLPVAQDATKGWERIPELTYPMGLPVTQPDYPCGVASPHALLTQRVRHHWPPGWNASAFMELHDQLKELVRGGPGSQPMADRIFAEPQSSANAPDADPPRMSKFYILDMVLLASLHPALAQAVGLYWVDRTVVPDAAYDYLIVADHTGVGQLNPTRVLGVIQSSGFAQLDGYIVFNKRAVAEPPLPPPTGLEAQEVSGGTFPDAQGELPQSSNNAGLRWDVGWDDSGALLPQSALMYLVWRADLGDAATPAPVSTYGLVTKLPPDDPRPVMVSESRLPDNLTERPPDWPQGPLHFIDRNLKDGWYGYGVSGIDIFGRHSARGAPVQLRLLDRIPPPNPTGVEAYALDPGDPYLQQDAPYQHWRDALDDSVRETLVGLRVRWRWTNAHQRQNLDTREFRIYFHPGSRPPDSRDQPVNWQERYFVVDYEQNFEIDAHNGDRAYEIFLPPADSADLVSIPLNPTTAEPVVYAHVGVSAADDKKHAVDSRPAGAWGNRPGNEGPVGPPAKIYRVLREPPPPPEDVQTGERLYASPADYHGLSFFTYRWKPRPDMMLHVFRALDDGVFRADWEHRRLPLNLDATQADLFPPGWNAATRQAVADELNHLNTFIDIEDGTGPAQAAAYYRQLSDAALRVLAGLPTSEDAFAQLTVNPLDPDHASNADRKGPDAPDEYAPDPDRRAFIDALDGRAANRYFYRAAFVDGAHNLGPSGLSSPPVYLPKVVPPRTPVVTKVIGGERRVTLRWAANREHDLVGYRIYRTESEASARDVRLMDSAATLTQVEINLSDPAAEWTDEGGLVGGHKYFYRLAAMDAFGNESEPTRVFWLVAVDTRVPPAPTWTEKSWLLRSINDSSFIPWPEDNVVPENYLPALRLGWRSETPEPEFVVTRMLSGGGAWEGPRNALQRPSANDPHEFVFFDFEADPAGEILYRVKVRSSSGVWSIEDAILSVPPKGGE